MPRYARRNAAIMLLVLLLAALVFIKGSLDLRNGDATLRSLNLSLISESNRTQKLRERLTYVQSDDYIEQVAREELGLILPGETRYLLSD